MTETSPSETSISMLLRRLSWTMATLDLCLDMERNRSDSQFAAADPSNEIVYVFDEDIFEIFIGGKREPPDDKEVIYRDRRRALGVFNISEWRRDRLLDVANERIRIDLNRQSAVLASEWLLTGALPGMRADRTIYVSRWHLQELKARWSTLAAYYRKISSKSQLQEEVRAVDAFFKDSASLALLNSESGEALALAAEASNLPAEMTDPREIERYVEAQIEPFRSDLADYWQNLGGEGKDRSSQDAANFWRMAFSRKLAATMADLRVSAPLTQLLRINGELVSRIRLVDSAGEIDDPEYIPESERFSFWKQKIAEELKVRNGSITRAPRAQENDAYTLALLQSLANAAVREGKKKRFVFVTSDVVLIDAYRRWHSYTAEAFEPFVLRPVRHFAPLLNIASMADEALDTPDETRGKQDIFPALQSAIEPLMLQLRLTTSGVGDPGRWPREQFTLRLRDLLRDARDPLRDDAALEAAIRERVAAPLFFPGSPLELLTEVEPKLVTLSEKGRALERLSIGMGFRWLCQRLDKLKSLHKEVIAFGDRDETALAEYMSKMVNNLGLSSLELLVRALDMSKTLDSVVTLLSRSAGLPALRVPLSLRIYIRRDPVEQSLTAYANHLLGLAVRRVASSRRGARTGALGFQEDDRHLLDEGGYKLFAVHACLALRLSRWDMATGYAREAGRLARTYLQPGDPALAELDYLESVAIRFRLSERPVLDATGADVTKANYDHAKALLRRESQKLSGSDVADLGLTELRAGSELLALMLFGCIWAMVPNDDPTAPPSPFQPAFYVGEALEAAGLSERLRVLLTCGLMRASAADEEVLAQVTEQVATNCAALYCLKRLHAARFRDGDVPASYPAAETLGWLDAYLRNRSVSLSSQPTISRFYFGWYRRLRVPGSKYGHRNHILELSIDKAVARLMTEAFPTVSG